jgi:hypothetical protein
VPQGETADVTAAKKRFVLDPPAAAHSEPMYYSHAASLPRGLAGYMDELRQWEWVERSTGEPRHDRYAGRSVPQIGTAQHALTKQLRAGLLNAEGVAARSWYHQGQPFPTCSLAATAGYC